MYNDPEVLNNFSKKLDTLLNEEPPSNDVNLIENFLTESILQASESEIPKIDPQVKKSPWANEEFLSLISSRRNCKDPSEKKELGKNISLTFMQKIQTSLISSSQNVFSPCVRERKNV